MNIVQQLREANPYMRGEGTHPYPKWEGWNFACNELLKLLQQNKPDWKEAFRDFFIRENELTSIKKWLNPTIIINWIEQNIPYSNSTWLQWIKVSDKMPTDLKKLYFIKAQKTYHIIGSIDYDGKLREFMGDYLKWRPEEIEWLDEAASQFRQPAFPIEFIMWYSGMKAEAIQKAYNRWNREQGAQVSDTTMLNQGTER